MKTLLRFALVALVALTAEFVSADVTYPAWKTTAVSRWKLDGTGRAYVKGDFTERSGEIYLSAAPAQGLILILK